MKKTVLITGATGAIGKAIALEFAKNNYENSNGTFLKYDGKEIKSTKYSNDKELQEKLWTISEELSHQQNWDKNNVENR